MILQSLKYLSVDVNILDGPYILAMAATNWSLSTYPKEPRKGLKIHKLGEI